MSVEITNHKGIHVANENDVVDEKRTSNYVFRL